MFLRLNKIIFVLLSFAFLVPNSPWADSWPSPEIEHYLSGNTRFRFRVVPRTRGKTSICKGRLEKLTGYGRYATYKRVWERELPNDVSPVSAIVSDRGKYVVTFDNWHSMGYGSNAVVIYGPGGKVVRELSLEDFLSKEEIERLPHTVSSIWWGRDHYFDENEEFVVLRVTEAEKLPFDEDTRFREIRIRLSDGKVLPASP